jgi:two-component system, OmpR family, response regulator MprA
MQSVLRCQSVSVSAKNKGPLILVVEDVEETRDGIERLLKTDGYRVDPARQEEDAVTTAMRKAPGLILVSPSSSPTHVITIARRVRDRAALSDQVPIVIFDDDSIAEGEELNMGDQVYLIRPDNFNQVRALIRRLLASVS